MKVTLPNGLVDGGDHFNVVEVDELRGKQQNYLADKDLIVGNIGHVEKILGDMILSLQTKEGLEWKGEKKELAWQLPLTDLETILIKIRENTYGEKFYHSVECNHCGKENKNLRLDLDKLEITPISLKTLTNAKKRTIKLPKSGIEAELKPLYLKDLLEILKITSNSTDKLVTSLSALSIRRLGKQSPVTAAHLDDLPVRDVAFLGEAVESGQDLVELEGSIDSKIEFTCQHCKAEAESKLNVFDPDFFSPTKTSPT
jgi:hypothetical protein